MISVQVRAQRPRRLLPLCFQGAPILEPFSADKEHTHVHTHREQEQQPDVLSGRALKDLAENGGKPRGKGKCKRNMRLWGDLSVNKRRNLNSEIQRGLKAGFKQAQVLSTAVHI